MKYLLSSLLLIALSVLLSACPYTSTVGIDDKTPPPIDPKLIGTWRKTAFPKDSTQLVISKSRENYYSIRAKLKDGANAYSNNTYSAWFADVSGTRLLNVYNASEKEYYFGMAILDNGKLTIKLLSDDITHRKYNRSSDLIDFLNKLDFTVGKNWDKDSDLNNLFKIKQ